MSETLTLSQMLRSMNPVLLEGEYVFVSVSADRARDLDGSAQIVEAEGCTVVLLRERADAAELAYSLVCSWITLTLNSELEAVGLTAAFAGALGKAGISCNVLAGFHHDHLLVPADQSELAMSCLRDLSESA